MRKLIYLCHPFAPSEEEIAEQDRGLPGGHPEPKAAARSSNIHRALKWLAWLRKSFPETTFIAPWIADLLSGADDSDPAQRERDLVDCCAVVERCDGIVLVGPRISSGMARERDHGERFHRATLELDPTAPADRVFPYRSTKFKVYDLTTYQIEGAAGRNEDGRTFAEWMHGYQEFSTR